MFWHGLGMIFTICRIWYILPVKWQNWLSWRMWYSIYGPDSGKNMEESWAETKHVR